MVRLVEKLPEDEQKTKPAIQQHYAFALNRSAHLIRRIYFIILFLCVGGKERETETKPWKF